MKKIVLTWQLYEAFSDSIPLTNIKFRGTLRKFALQQQINILVENATDKENVVRFAILVDYDSLKNIEMIGVFLKEKFEEKVKILSLKDFRFVENPVLSKLSVNDSSRY
jgi:hypothetical protein